MNANAFCPQAQIRMGHEYHNGMTRENGSIILAAGGAVYDTAKDHPPPPATTSSSSQLTSFSQANPLMAGMAPEYFYDYSPERNQPRYWTPSASFFKPTDYASDNGFAVDSTYAGAASVKRPNNGSFGGFVASNGAGGFIPYSYAMQQSVGTDLRPVPTELREASYQPSITEAMLDPRLRKKSSGNIEEGSQRNILLKRGDRPVAMTVNYLQKMIVDKYANKPQTYEMPAAVYGVRDTSQAGGITSFATPPAGAMSRGPIRMYMQ